MELKRVILKRKNGRVWPFGKKNEKSVPCLCRHDFMSWTVLTYHGGRRSGWYARDEHIYSEGQIREAWVLPDND